MDIDGKLGRWTDGCFSVVIILCLAPIKVDALLCDTQPFSLLAVRKTAMQPCYFRLYFSHRAIARKGFPADALCETRHDILFTGSLGVCYATFQFARRK